MLKPKQQVKQPRGRLIAGAQAHFPLWHQDCIR